jgi:Tfp pilus assembly protein PilO
MNLPRIRIRLWQQIGLASALAVCVLLAAARMVYVPLWGNAAQNRAAAFDLQVKLSDAQSVTPLILEQERRLELSRLRVQELQSELGSGQNLARTLEQLDDCAVKAGVLMSLSQDAALPAPVDEVLSMQQVTVTVQVSGRYPQLGQFFNQLAQAPFVSRVRSLSVTRHEPSSSQLAATILLELLLSGDAA